MAMFTGNNGKAYYDGGEIGNVTSWSVDVNMDTVETTVMAETWKSKLPSHKDWSGTIEINMDSTNFDPGIDNLGEDDGEVTPSPVEVKFMFGDEDGDGYLEGPCLLTGISASVTVGDVTTVSYTFEGNGEIEYGNS